MDGLTSRCRWPRRPFPPVREAPLPLVNSHPEGGERRALRHWLDVRAASLPPAGSQPLPPDLADEAIFSAYLHHLRKLADGDPNGFLEAMLPLHEWAALPEPWRRQLGEPFNQLATIDVLWSTTVDEDGLVHCSFSRSILAGGERLPVNLAALRQTQGAKRDIPLDGWNFAGTIVVGDRSFRLLSSDELRVANTLFPPGNPDHICPVTGDSAQPEMAILMGGKVWTLAHAGVVEELAAEWHRALAAFGPKVKHPSPWLGQGEKLPVTQSDRTETPLTVLFIRVDFSDFPGEPVTQAALTNTLTAVASRIEEYSYNKTTISATVTSKYYRMTTTGTVYAQTGDNDALHAEAQALAAADGYNLADYEVIGVFFPNLGNVPNSQIDYAGLASVGGQRHWLNGANSESTITHEFGHNYGLYHANFWHPEHELGGAYNDPSGHSLEYGDIFDRMGSGSVAKGHFNPYFKNRLDWLPDDKVTTVSGSGTYRLYTFDNAAALANPALGLVVPWGGDVTYWLGYRRLFTDVPNLANGVYGVAEGLYAGRSNLIDLTPNSQASASADRQDAGLPLSTTFEDATAGVTITPLSRGGTPPQEWIDVQILVDARLGLSQTDQTFDERRGTAEVEVVRSFSTLGAAGLQYSTTEGTATAGTDFHEVTGALAWASGESTALSIVVPIIPDTLDEGVETITLDLAGATGAVLENPASATVRIADPGQRDPAFAPPFFNTVVRTIVEQPDGKVLAGGSIKDLSSAPSLRNIARFASDGSLDLDFATNAGTGFNLDTEVILLLPDGTILVGGQFSTYNGVAANRLSKLLPDGTVDPAFQTGGGPNGTVYALAREASGQILVGGAFTTWDGVTARGLIRLNPDGSRDTVNPLAQPFGTQLSTTIRDLLVEEDGRIMVAGVLYIEGLPGGFRSGVCRLLATGVRDSSFDPGHGAHLDGSTGNLTTVYAVERLLDGRYVVGGSFTAFNNDNSRARLAGLLANGSIDPGFTPTSLNEEVRAMVRRPGDLLAVAGFFSSGEPYFAQFRADGSVDPGFNTGTGPGSFINYALAGGRNGTLYLGGNFFSYNGSSSRPLVRVFGGVDPYEEWREANFTASQIVQGGTTTDPQSDWDGDGWTNYLEMLFGTSPVLIEPQNQQDAIAYEVAQVGNDRFLEIEFTKPVASGVWWVPQSSGNLLDWSPAPAWPGTGTVEILEDSSIRLRARDTTPLTPGQGRYLRIHAVKPGE